MKRVTLLLALALVLPACQDDLVSPDVPQFGKQPAPPVTVACYFLRSADASGNPFGQTHVTIWDVPSGVSYVTVWGTANIVDDEGSYVISANADKVKGDKGTFSGSMSQAIGGLERYMNVVNSVEFIYGGGRTATQTLSVNCYDGDA